MDSGREHVLAAPWIVRAPGAHRATAHRTISLGIGGHTVGVELIDLTLRLHPPDAPDDVYVEWLTEVGTVNEWRAPWPMVLGQVGFFDAFTVTMSRLSAELAVEDVTTYDARYPPGYLRR